MSTAATNPPVGSNVIAMPAPAPSNRGLLAVAEAYTHRSRDRIAFIVEGKDKGPWRRFDGTRWIEDPLGVGFNKLYDRMLRSWYERSRDPNERQREFIGEMARDYDSKKRYDVEKLVRLRVIVSQGIFDTRPYLLNCPNGTVDLRTGEMHQHRAEEYLTQITNVGYNPDAKCPRFERFLQEITKDRGELEAGLRRFIGYGATGETRDQRLPIWSGEGGNGKGVLVNAITAALGDDYVKSIQKEVVLRGGRRNNEHLRELHRAREARLLLINEPDGEWDAGELKELSGEDRIKARAMYKDGFEYDPKFKLVVRVNDIPRLKDLTTGAKRRLRIYPFDVDFSKNPDRELGAKLRTEAEGILALIVREAVAYYKEGLVECEEILLKTEEYFDTEADDAGYAGTKEFFATIVEITKEPADQVDKSDMTELFDNWSEAQEKEMPNHREFCKILKYLGVTDERSKGRRWWGGVKTR